MDDLSPAEKREALRKSAELEALSKRMDVWCDAADEHLAVASGSEIDLAKGLRAWREIERLKQASGDADLDLSLSEYTEKVLRDPSLSVKERAKLLSQRPALEAKKEAAKRFSEQLTSGLLSEDRCAFLERLLKAGRRESKGPIHPVDAKGATVLAFNNLRQSLERRPTKPEVQALVEQWRREGGLLPVGNWPRIFKDPAITSLFRKG